VDKRIYSSVSSVYLGFKVQARVRTITLLRQPIHERGVLRMTWINGFILWFLRFI
jgi:hypothetical protein